ncbi:Tetratricopeptide repeat protein [Stieleria maiorica]|uniref:Tetratricopeptide repeat protein n=1 Tax=Stieleria maiorica TaxID=2795974 RepID=A0A5B9MIX8_9BACT|nr:tetratricopeptide repeat protein [Stieleria maiorica]QEF99565.1 Tetratricopeptide repeat protein [Stieleria maiorica]
MHFLNPLAWFRWMGEFVRCWFLGIPWRDAPKAIPAIILSLVLFTTGFIAFSGGAGWRNRQLERQLRVALDREDFPTAEIVIRRQLEADPSNVQLIHRFALVREAQSFEEEAKVLMRRLLTRRHLPAAKWLLENQIIGKKLNDFEPEELDEIGTVLELITESENDNLGVKRMYAEYLVYRQRLSSAIPVLIELSQSEPMRGLQAAALARQLNEMDAAERYASTALERVEEMHKDDPTNSYYAMSIARNQIFLERHSDAIRTLKRSVDVAKTPDERRVLTQALGDAIIAYITYIEKSPTNTVQERLRVLRMLDAAVKIAPNNPRVVTMVADHVLSNLNESDAQITSVREALISGSPAGIAHFIKGTAALMKQDQPMAELHLEKAAEQMPRSGAILNNLAVALAMKDEPEYEKALQVSNAAIDNVPTATPHFFETRGQILFRMGRFRDAISDLERALTEPSLASKAHQMLADCYDKVGDQDLAQGHREAAEKLAEEQTSAMETGGQGSADQPADDAEGR